MSLCVNADNARRFLGSERRRSSHLEKRVVSRVLRGVVEVSLRVSWESSAVRVEMSEVNFSGSGMGEGVGLDVVEPMVLVQLEGC